MKSWRCMLLWGVVLCAAACGNHQEVAAGQDSTAVVATEPVSREKWMVLKYDDLRLREAPSKAGAVLATMKEGTQVLDLGDRSENKETIELRGEKITAPWAKVRLPDGKEGWVFAGALGPAPDPSIATFAKTLAGLPITDCKNMRVGLAEFAKAMQGKTPAVADQAMVPLLAFLGKVADDQNRQLSADPDYDKMGEKLGALGDAKPDPAAKAKADAWEACGLELQFPEGMVYIALQPGLAIPTVEPFVSQGMRRYLEIRKKEDQNIWSGDGGLSITPMELADRAVTWDAFLIDHPDFEFKKEIRQTNLEYLGTLLVGLDNTPAFDYSSGKLFDDTFKSAWDWVLKNKPETETGQTLKTWCDLLKANNWKRGPKAEKFLQDFWKKSE